ncbi:hypothetical protein [Gracilimonas sp. BCB1]|uniref:hypothetical protein n=1 Tax=Gracilimonas sp. BCB1 TaxID=3152362 RepID=UPI0032D966EA
MSNLYAQEIDFGDFSSRYTTISPVLIQPNLDFGTIAQNQGVKEIEITDAAIIELEGIKYLDVLIDIELLAPFDTDGCSNANCTLPFTLKGAYSNFGEDSEVSALNNTRYIGETTIDFSQQTGVLSTQFPILSRTSAPPGPPPTPVYKGYNLEVLKESAYLFIYGSINASGQISGTYSADIQVTIYYD